MLFQDLQVGDCFHFGLEYDTEGNKIRFQKIQPVERSFSSDGQRSFLVNAADVTDGCYHRLGIEDDREVYKLED